MSKQPNIRWRDNDKAELRRIVKNFNAKISRERKKLIENDERYAAAHLPTKRTVRELEAEIRTRKDFHEVIDNMQNYIKTGLKYKVDANTRKSLTATVRDFNKKVDRLMSKAKDQSEIAMLPEKLSVDALLKNANSKQELKADLNIFKAFLKKDAEKAVPLPDTKFNIKLTKWQKEVMEDMLTGINKRREDELQAWKETQVKYGGKEAGYVQGQARMSDDDFDQFQQMDMYNYSSSYSDMKAKFQLMLREKKSDYWDARAELARINYTELLDSLVGDTLIGQDLLKHIKSLDIADFKRVLKSEDDLWLMIYRMKQKILSDQIYNEVMEEIWNEWKPGEDMNERLDELIWKKGSKTYGQKIKNKAAFTDKLMRDARKAVREAAKTTTDKDKAKVKVTNRKPKGKKNSKIGRKKSQLKPKTPKIQPSNKPKNK